MKLRLWHLVLLITLAAGAQPAMSAFWQWSKTPASNATADPTINWAEGMAPSSINDSARAQMARTAEWRDDISGALTTAGSSTAYTLSTNEGNIPSPPANGTMLAFVAHASNGANPTLQVDNGTAYPLQFSAGVALPGGTLILGTPYRVAFNATQNAWVLEGGTSNPYNIPLGGLLPYTGPVAPNSNFILPAGQCISATTYAAYWALLGSPASGACPGGQFAVLDMRGNVPAGLDNLNGSAANRLTSATTGCGTAMTAVGASCANGGQSYVTKLAELPSIPSSGSMSGSMSGGGSASNVILNGSGAGIGGGGSFGIPGTASVSVSVSGSVSGSVTSTGTNSTAHPTVQPTVGVTYLLRVL